MTKPKITLTSTFRVYPPTSGGTLRIFNLCRQLSRKFSIEIVSLTGVTAPSSDRVISDDVREIVIPKTKLHAMNEREMGSGIGPISVTDIAMSLLFALTPDYLAALSLSCKMATRVICAHPYPFRAVRSVTEKAVWYDSHNVEADLKREMFSQTAKGASLAAKASVIERECCDESELILPCSQDDLVRLQQLYGVSLERLICVPNGFDPETQNFFPWDERRKRGRDDGKLNVAFVGSMHPPNVEAVQLLIEWAPQIPDAQFLIVGSIEQAFKAQSLPENLRIAGVVSEAELAALLRGADLAVNPMRSGSGSSHKIMLALATGLPLISTLKGARGFGLTPGQHFIRAEVDEFAGAIRAFRRLPDTQIDRLTKNARDFVEKNFPWDRVVQPVLDRFTSAT